MKTVIKTSSAPLPAGPYSQALRVGNTIYVSGQGPRDAATGQIPETISEQSRQALRNIQSVLEAGGVSLSSVVRIGVHLSNMSYFKEFNEVYSEFFHEPYPARTTVGSQLNGILVEIDAVAVVPPTLDGDA